MTARIKTRLVKRDDPAYWEIFDVYDGDTRVGTIRKEGRTGTDWLAHNTRGGFVAARPKKPAVLAALVA